VEWRNSGLCFTDSGYGPENSRGRLSEIFGNTVAFGISGAEVNNEINHHHPGKRGFCPIFSALRTATREIEVNYSLRASTLCEGIAVVRCLARMAFPYPD
jgi:hypothetical protein